MEFIKYSLQSADTPSARTKLSLLVIDVQLLRSLPFQDSWQARQASSKQVTWSPTLRWMTFFRFFVTIAFSEINQRRVS